MREERKFPFIWQARLVGTLSGTLEVREEQPSAGCVRLTLAMCEQGMGRPIRVRLKVPREKGSPGAFKEAEVEVKRQLMPSAAPKLLGDYDFARTAGFAGLAATGDALGIVNVLSSPRG